MILKHRHMEQMFNEGLSFVDLLPYLEYMDDICILADGSLGKIWKINVIGIEGKAEADLNALMTQWQNFLTRLPNENFACQFILKADPNNTTRIREYAQYHEGSDVSSDFLDTKTSFISKNEACLFEHNNKKFILKDIAVHVAIRFFPTWKNEPQHGVDRALREHKCAFEQHIGLLEGMFRSIGISADPLSAQDLAVLLYGTLNPKRSRTIPHHGVNEEESIRDQILFNFPQADQRGFVLEDQHMRVISLKEMPIETTVGMLTKETYEGSTFCLLDQGMAMTMVINITVPDPQKALGRIKMQKDFAYMHKENWLGDQSIESIAKKNELDQVVKELYQGNQRIVHARFHWVISGPNEHEVEVQSDAIINGLNRLQCEGMKEDLIGASLFLTCLPFNFDPYYENFIRRSRRLLSHNVADMLPVLGAYQGTPTAAQVYLNRRGEAVFLDMFDSNINPHGVVVGASGAGKSFFINDFILQVDRLGSHFFVLDKGDSYKKLCRILEGQYIAFDLNKPVTINPFVHPPTPENLSFLLSLLSQMASGGDERYRLSREEEGLLHQAIITTYRQKEANREVFLSDVTSVLNDGQFNDQCGINSLMGPTLALRLTPFTRKGPYGGFFDGTNQFTINTRFVAFELANLSSYPDLQVAVLLNLMFFMTNFVADLPMRAKRKYLLIDEAWSLLKLKNTADFITNAFKTFRKYRCSTIAITQEIADLTRVESGIAIIANASNKIFLKQESAVIDLLKDCLSLDDQKIRLLKTIETVKGKFSEALVITDSSCGVIRLVPDPFLYWVANSEPRNNEYLMKRTDEYNGDLMCALHACAKEYPYGL